MAQWLAGSADATVAKERASAVRALAPLHEERVRFYALSRQVGESSGDPDRFVAWATGEPWLASRRWLIGWANLSALIAVALLIVVVVSLTGMLPRSALKYGGFGLITLTVVNFGLTGAMLGPAHQIFSIAMSTRQAVGNYQELFHTAQSLPMVESRWLSGSNSARDPEWRTFGRSRNGRTAEDRLGWVDATVGGNVLAVPAAAIVCTVGCAGAETT